MREFLRVAAFAAAVLWTAGARAQSGVSVELDDVTDNRVSAGRFQGTLELRVKLSGAVLEKAQGARIVVKEARDDANNALTDSSDLPDFTPRDYNSGTLQVSLRQPARAATSVRVKGIVELYLPSRDPGAIVNIEKALSKLDVPFSAKGLKAAKVTITPLSKEGYAAAQKSRKLDDAKIAEIRAEGKKRGVSEKEVDQMIEFAKALESIDADPAAGGVYLSAKKSDFDRVFRIEILGADGKPVSVPSRGTSSRGDDSIMTLNPSEPPSPDATIQIALLTEKSRVSYPFELKVALP